MAAALDLTPDQRRQRADQLTRAHIGHSGGNWFGRIGVDVIVGQREGAYVWDIDGRRYLDVLCDGTTYNLGHRHAEILTAAKSAIDEVDIGCQFLVSEARAELAARLIELAPPGMTHVHFATSGSEANDAALKAAFFATGRRGVISIDDAFHGVTGLAVQAGHPHYAEPFGIAPEGRQVRVPWNDAVAMEAALQRGDIAAVILETIPATAGWPMPDDDYLPTVRRLCDQYGALMIADEIQTGLGRLGKLWGCQVWDVAPDILTMAKGAGGGVYPLAYVLMNDRASAWIDAHPMSMPSTFGGSEIGCRIGLKVLEISAAPDFLSHVNRMGAYLADHYRRLRARHPTILSEVRQLGLASALKLSTANGGRRMMTALFRHGVLAILAGFDPSVIQIKPPLIIEPADIDFLVSALGKALTDVATQA